MSAESTKECRVCGEAKPLDAFHKRPDTSDGRFSRCKACHLAMTQAWRARNPDRVRTYVDRARERRAENPEKVREQNRKWHVARRDERAAYSRKWKMKNADRVSEYNRAWAKKHPEYFVAQVIRRRYALGPSTSEDLKFIAVLRHDPCSYCGGTAGTVDHIDPLHHGGDGHWSNLTASCRSCNASKSTKPLIKFLLKAA